MERGTFNGLRYCKQCNYSANPKVIENMKKHFHSFRCECHRCGYSTETKDSKEGAIELWNK